MDNSISFPAEDGLTPLSFHRYNRRLRGLLLDRQAWFVMRDLARLTNSHLGPRTVQKLDPDQTRRVKLAGVPEEELLVSESGVYALLMLHFYHPENRSLRQWLSHEVVPVLRDAQQPSGLLPRHRMRQIQGQQVAVLDWQGRLWVRFADAARLMELEARS